MNSEELDREIEQALHAKVRYGHLRGRQAVADDKLKGVYALLHDDAPEGTVSDKDAWIRRQGVYKEAIRDKQKAYAEWETAKIYMSVLLAAIEKYRTDQATERTLMRAGE